MTNPKKPFDWSDYGRAGRRGLLLRAAGDS